MAADEEDILCEREAVQFEIPTEGFSDAELQLVHHIKEVAESVLYHWRTFPIVLPAPVAVQNNDVSSSSLARRRPIVVRDLFVAPCFDELEAVALDSGGEPRKLDSKQLAAVRESGEFEVESVNFAGQVHRWRLSRLLQMGTERSYQSYRGHLALALRFLVVTARGRIVSHFFSLRQSARSLLRGLILLVDVFLGFPSVESCDLEAKLMEERSKYLVAELVCKPDQEAQLDALCDCVRDQLSRLRSEQGSAARLQRPPLLYRFHTPHGQGVDLRLFDRELMRAASPLLAEVLEREARGWFCQFRERIVTELQSQGMDDQQILTVASAAVQDEYLRRVLVAVRTSPQLEALGEGVAQLLAENAQSVVLMHRAVENVSRKLSSFQKSLRHYIETHHPVKSLIPAWVRHQFRTAECRFASEHQFAGHEEALALCKQHGLHQTAYFLHRDLVFMREREPVLQKELRRVKTATRHFQWRTHIWLPANWVVHRTFQGDSKLIPTVISHTSTSITDPRNDPSQPVFVLERDSVRVTTTRWLLWRWCCFVFRLWSWASNAFYLLGVVIPWSSPLSLRALFCAEPYTAELELSQVNGTLCPRRSSLTLTLTSRLLSLWRHISKSRTEFETSPDTGFIGKDMTRHLNRVWNYALKGVLGTLLLVTVFPALCLLTSALSLMLAATVPVWAPAAVLCFHLVCITVYDFDSPAPSRNRWCVLLEALVWRVGVLGILQPVAALLVAGLLCPLLALGVLVYGWLRWVGRRIWDKVAYDAIISRKGRIPCGDSVLVTRVHGPGLSSDYYLQIRAEQALAAFEARLEADELTAFSAQTSRRIEQPQVACAAFISRVFSGFSAQLGTTGVYGKLCEEANQLNTTLQGRLEKRQYDLQTGLSPAQRRKVKLTPRDLQLTLVAGARMLQEFYPRHVLARLDSPSGDTKAEVELDSAGDRAAADVTADVTTEAERSAGDRSAVADPPPGRSFWEGRGLAADDWDGLSAQILTEVFSQEVLTPLHPGDTHFYLEVHRVALQRYSELLRRAAASPPAQPVVPTAAHLRVSEPVLDISAFSPTAAQPRDRSASARRSKARRLRPWKRNHSTPIYTAEKLSPRLPLPHPLRVALTVYNRESDSPVCAEDSAEGRRLLAALEHVSAPHQLGGSEQEVQGGDGAERTRTAGGDGAGEQAAPSDGGNLSEEEGASRRASSERRSGGRASRSGVCSDSECNIGDTNSGKCMDADRTRGSDDDCSSNTAAPSTSQYWVPPGTSRSQVPVGGGRHQPQWRTTESGHHVLDAGSSAGNASGMDFVTVRLSDLAMMDSADEQGDLRSHSLRTTDV